MSWKVDPGILTETPNWASVGGWQPGADEVRQQQRKERQMGSINQTFGTVSSDLVSDLLRVGTSVRSFDWPESKASYIEGVVFGHRWMDGSIRYVIVPTMRVVENIVTRTPEGRVHPPAKGVPYLNGELVQTVFAVLPLEPNAEVGDDVSNRVHESDRRWIGHTSEPDGGAMFRLCRSFTDKGLPLYQFLEVAQARTGRDPKDILLHIQLGHCFEATHLVAQGLPNILGQCSGCGDVVKGQTKGSGFCQRCKSHSRPR